MRKPRQLINLHNVCSNRLHVPAMKSDCPKQLNQWPDFKSHHFKLTNNQNILFPNAFLFGEEFWLIQKVVIFGCATWYNHLMLIRVFSTLKGQISQLENGVDEWIASDIIEIQLPIRTAYPPIWAKLKWSRWDIWRPRNQHLERINRNTLWNYAKSQNTLFAHLSCIFRICRILCLDICIYWQHVWKCWTTCPIWCCQTALLSELAYTFGLDSHLSCRYHLWKNGIPHWNIPQPNNKIRTALSSIFMGKVCIARAFSLQGREISIFSLPFHFQSTF